MKWIPCEERWSEFSPCCVLQAIGGSKQHGSGLFKEAIRVIADKAKRDIARVFKHIMCLTVFQEFVFEISALFLR